MCNKLRKSNQTQLSQDISDIRERVIAIEEAVIVKQKTIDDLNQVLEKKRLQTEKLENEKNLIKTKLEETQDKLDLAITRLHQQTVKPGISGGGSRSDKLKKGFANLKMRLFYNASSKVLQCWQQQEPALDFRSEEFSQIRSILSQRVFADGMSYFARDKSEVNAYIELVINTLISSKELNLTPPILQIIQQKIETNLFSLKGVDTSDEALMRQVETTIEGILEDLRKIRDFSPSEDVLQEIKNFVEVGLRLVRDVVNDPSSGEFYIPETGAEFDEKLHDTRDEPEGKIKLTICAGYRIPGTVLVKADVVTCASSIQTPSDVFDTKVTSATESSALEDTDVINEGKHDESPFNQYQPKPIINSEESEKHKNIYAAKENLSVPGSHIEGQPPDASKISPHEEEHRCEGN